MTAYNRSSSRIHLARASGLALALMMGGSAQATIYAVGTGPGCTHPTLAAAMTAAVADTSPGPHEIRLLTGTIAAFNVEIIDPAQDIRVIGGHAGCDQAFPEPAQRTTIHAGGVDGRRVFLMANAGERISVTLGRLTLTGGRNPAPDNLGGAIYASGNMNLQLLADTEVISNLAQAGGGIAVGNPFDGPVQTLLQLDSARFEQNTASGGGLPGDGGAVLATGSSFVILRNVEFFNNLARRHGGGLALDGPGTYANLWPTFSSDRIRFEANRALPISFSESMGYGGAIYSRQGNLNAIGTWLEQVSQLQFLFNEADFGGAIYAVGTDNAAGPFTELRLRNPVFQGNTAQGRGGAVYLRNAVDYEAVKWGSGPCPANPGGLCVSFRNNESRNEAGIEQLGSGGAAYLDHAAGAPRPALRIAGALFSGNRDPNGTAAVIDARNNSSIRVLRSVFVDNASGTNTGIVFRSLIESRNDTLFGYNTVLANNVERVFYQIADTNINLHGSIVHVPGTQILWGGGTASTFSGCVISHPDGGLIGASQVTDPMIGPNFRPLPTALAVDFCNAGVGDIFWPSDRDAFGLPLPVAFGSPLFGDYDLGAIELRDIVFRDRFQLP